MERALKHETQEMKRRILNYATGRSRAGGFGMKRVGVLLFTLALAALTAHSQDAAWATLARNDLQAIHDLLRDNHPGCFTAGRT
jgi:hypothetical protein